METFFAGYAAGIWTAVLVAWLAERLARARARRKGWL
jgi:hypothetical protein